MPFDKHSAVMARMPAPANPAVNQRLLDGRGEFLGYLRRRLGSFDEAEDALQDFNLKVIRASPSVERSEKINAWLGQILRHTLIDHYRRRAVRRRAETSYALDITIGEAGFQTSDNFGTFRCLYAALPRLRTEYAEILRRADLEEEPRILLAAALGLTTNALNVRLYRARQALRKELEISCPACRTGCFLDCAYG